MGAHNAQILAMGARDVQSLAMSAKRRNRGRGAEQLAQNAGTRPWARSAGTGLVEPGHGRPECARMAIGVKRGHRARGARPWAQSAGTGVVEPGNWRKAQALGHGRGAQHRPRGARPLALGVCTGDGRRAQAQGFWSQSMGAWGVQALAMGAKRGHRARGARPWAQSAGTRPWAQSAGTGLVEPVHGRSEWEVTGHGRVAQAQGPWDQAMGARGVKAFGHGRRGKAPLIG